MAIDYSFNELIVLFHQLEDFNFLHVYEQELSILNVKHPYFLSLELIKHERHVACQNIKK